MDWFPGSRWLWTGDGCANGNQTFSLSPNFESANANDVSVFKPLIAIQNNLPVAQISVGMSLAVFTQTFGGALFLSFAQTTFSNGLTKYIPTYAPGINAQTVIQAGATAVRQSIPPIALDGVLEAYNKSINDAFYLSTGASVAMFVFCWGLGWKSIKKIKKIQQEA